MSQIPFVDFARDGAGVWDGVLLAEYSARAFPYEVLFRARDIVQADVYLEWIRWYAEGLVDPSRFVNVQTPYGVIFEAVLKAIDKRFVDRTLDEKKRLSSAIATYLQWRVDNLKHLAMSRNRKRLSLSVRRHLVELAGAPPRCWITGRPFSKESIAAFLFDPEDQGTATIGSEPPLYVDVYRPIGLTRRDEAIEVDHVMPMSRGGSDEDNLRLACGWANANKRHHVSLYDVPGGVRHSVVRANEDLVPPTLPQPFWVVRLLATRRRCEHPGGCSAHVANAELTVAPIEKIGAPTPTNLRVVCSRHDSMSEGRFVPRKVAASAWGIERTSV